MDAIKIYELKDIAGALFDGGWRSTDRHAIKSEYDFSGEELEVIIAELKEIELGYVNEE